MPGTKQSFLSPDGRRFLATYDGVRGRAVAPMRSQFRLRQFDAFVDRVFWSDWLDSEQVPARCVGSFVKSLVGAAAEGHLDQVADLDPQVKALRAWRLTQVVRKPCGVWTQFRVGPALAIETITVPYMADDAGPALLLNACFSVGLSEAGGCKCEDVDLSKSPDQVHFLDLGAGIPEFITPYGRDSIVAA